MTWSLAVSELATSWKVGIAFACLVVVRLFLTTQSALVGGARTLVLGSLADVFGAPAPSREADAESETAGGEEAGSTQTAGEEVAGEQTDRPHARPQAEQMRHSVLEFVDSVLIALALVFLVIRPFVVQAFYIPSASMHPTLVENDKILVSKFIYHLRPPHRGDVIVFRAPRNAEPGSPDDKDFIKRLVALPGDTIAVHDSQVWVNGKALHEDYIAERPDYEMPPEKVEPGKVFVMGDNRNNSNDSHYWGQLDENRILGKAEVIFWPLSRAGIIH